jgi:MFS family permease
MAVMPPQASFLATRRGKLTLALLAAVAFLDFVDASIGRRRVLVAGTVLIGVSSLIGGFAESTGVLVGARLAQGLGAAMMLPAALSILTTTFKEGTDRNKALGVWGAVGGLASAAGVLLGGLLTNGPGWRWVMFVNPVATVLVLASSIFLVAAAVVALRATNTRGEPQPPRVEVPEAAAA